MSTNKNQINTQAIILAGGLGTRLQSVVSDVPKCMAPVDGIPFIHFIITWLKNEGISSFILALGYKSEIVIEYITKHFTDTPIEYVVEDHPLGTGGAIKLACGKAITEDVIIVNGDTLFNINIKNLVDFHQNSGADFTAALKEMHNFSRYGSVHVDDQHNITAFNEKQFCAKGLINGGVYVLKKTTLLKDFLPLEFSFEKDFLERSTGKKQLMGLPFDNYFIDIGIPEDYSRFKDDYHLILNRPLSANNKTKSAKGGDETSVFEIIGLFLEAISDFDD